MSGGCAEASFPPGRQWLAHNMLTGMPVSGLYSRYIMTDCMVLMLGTTLGDMPGYFNLLLSLLFAIWYFIDLHLGI